MCKMTFRKGLVMFNKKIVVIDIETTGFDIYRDAIIEVAALSFEGDKEPEIFSAVVSPSIEVPERILRLTGISRQELEQAKPLAAYRDILIQLCQNAVIVGHNVEFDLGFLEQALNIHFANPIWDTLDMARIFFPSMISYKLGYLYSNLTQDKLENAHRALADAQATWRILQICWEKGLTLDLGFYDRALALAGNSKVAGFLKELQNTIKKKFPARLISTDLVLNNQDLGLFAEAEKEEEVLPKDVQWIENCFSPGGILETYLPGYESRLGQLQMAKAIGNALIASKHVVIEAGTGTGKSYAYLIPSLWWAKRTGKKVVVATHTIPLQEQLYKKDLPILAKVLPFNFKVALLKGKGNYICLKRWLAQVNGYKELDSSERLPLISILMWLRETVSGDKQEISRVPDLEKVWGSLNAEEESCVPNKCPHANRCFMLQARKRAEEANIIIVNHSLLFSDIKTENKILPEYHELIIDEAHHLHESALEQLGNDICLEQIQRVINLIASPIAGSLYSSVKANIKFWEGYLQENNRPYFRAYLEQLPEAAGELSQQAQELFSIFEQVLGSELSYRITVQSQKETWWQTVTVQTENLLGRLSQLLEVLKALVKLLEYVEDEEAKALNHEIVGRIRNLEEIRDCFVLAQQVEHPGRVSWLEYNNRLFLKTSPVDVSAILKEKLFAPLDCAVLTSATISISNSFQHFLGEVGLEPDTFTLIVDSPFAYDRQMELMVVKDMLDKGESDLFNVNELARFIAEVTERMQGRTLVLFTAHRFLREVYQPLCRYLDSTGIEILAQGIDGGRQAILEAFLNNPRSVLLGANSFWEGIDIPGNKLACVIVVKLPFGPPNRPLIAARAEYLEAQGKNSFYEYLLPEAVIRFKQGFGRLIRSKTDRGIVILCDGRVIEKRYGRIFLNSLPLKTHSRSTRQQIIDKIDIWLDEEQQKQLL